MQQARTAPHNDGVVHSSHILFHSSCIWRGEKVSPSPTPHHGRTVTKGKIRKIECLTVHCVIITDQLSKQCPKNRLTWNWSSNWESTLSNEHWTSEPSIGHWSFSSSVYLLIMSITRWDPRFIDYPQQCFCTNNDYLKGLTEENLFWTQPSRWNIVTCLLFSYSLIKISLFSTNLNCFYWAERKFYR